MSLLAIIDNGSTFVENAAWTQTYKVARANSVADPFTTVDRHWKKELASGTSRDVCSHLGEGRARVLGDQPASATGRMLCTETCSKARQSRSTQILRKKTAMTPRPCVVPRIAAKTVVLAS